MTYYTSMAPKIILIYDVVFLPSSDYENSQSLIPYLPSKLVSSFQYSLFQLALQGSSE